MQGKKIKHEDLVYKLGKVKRKRELSKNSTEQPHNKILLQQAASLHSPW